MFRNFKRAFVCMYVCMEIVLLLLDNREGEEVDA